MGRRTHALSLQREIAELRSQVGAEINNLTSAGIKVRLGDIDEEYVPELKTIKGRMAIYDRMVNDPVVRGQLTAITMTLISGVRWKVVGGNSKVRDLVGANLLREGPKKYWCSTSWNDRLYEALGCLVYGFAMFAKTREIVDGQAIFSDLKWLHPRSVDEDGWDMDEGDNLLNVRRTYTNAKGEMKAREPIPAEDVFLVPWDRRGPNWEGNAFIRPMYRPWKERDLAAKIDLIDLQNRGVGIPIAKLSGAGGVKERDTLVSILKDLRGGSKERAFIVIEKDEEVKYLLSEGQAREAASIMDRSAADSARVGGTQYLESGNTQSGSRASSSSMSTGFFIHTNAIRIRLQDIINFGAGPMMGLTEELEWMNTENDQDVDDPVRIEGSTVSPTEQLDNIPLIGDSVAKGVIPPHYALANEALRRLNWPEMTKEEYDEAIAAKTPSPAIGGPGRPDGAGTDPEGRDDTMSRRFAGEDAAQKKTLDGGNQPPKSPASWRWIRSKTG